MHYTRISSRASEAVASLPVSRRPAALLVVAFLIITSLGSPALAQGSSECDSPVVDDGAGVDEEQILEVISETSLDGPRYVVRSFDTVPDADLGRYLDELVAECFVGDDAELDDDVVLLSVASNDRVSAVDVGDDWSRAIPASERDRIRTEVMSPQFQQGNYTDGLVDAIIATDQLIIDVESANANSSDSDEAVSQVDDDSSVENSGQSSTRSTLYAIVGALGLMLAGIIVFFFVNSRRKLAMARRSLAKSLAGPRLKMGSTRERFDRLTGQADVWERTTAGKTKAKLRSLVRESSETHKDAEREAALLSSAIPNGVEDGSMNELRRARGAGVALAKSLEVHELELDRLTAFGAHLDHLRIALPTKKELLTEELVEAELLAASRQGQGWSTDEARSTLTNIEQGLSGVSFDNLELDLLALAANVEQAEADLFATAHSLQSLPDQLESLKTWDNELDEAADLELTRIDSLRKELSMMAHDHASGSWDWAVDNPEQALEELELAHQLQTLAISEQIPARNLNQAGKSLEQAGLHLMETDRLLDHVDDLLVDLQRAKSESPSLLAQAEEILDDLTKFVASHPADLDPAFQNEPGEFSRAIAGIQTELNMERPNYLRAAETLDRINRRLDETLAGARDAQARAQALRREAAREVARADRTLQRAERALGWELFPSKDGHVLDRLRAALSDLPDDPQGTIVVAANVADGAIQVQERIIARRRRRTAWATTGSGGGFGGGWASGSGSGGSSWSRGGGRSSGGRSFGGGVSRGGRSFGGGRSIGSF